MTVETAPFINGLNSASPGPSDLKSEGDDQIRLLKSSILATFPNITGAVTPTQTAINQLFTTISVDTSNNVTLAGRLQANVASTNVLTSGLTVEGGSVSAGSLSPMVAFSSANLNAGIWSARYTSYGGDLIFGTQGPSGGNPAERLRLNSAGVATFGSSVRAGDFNGYLQTGNVSQFTNDAGYVTSAGTVSTLHVTGTSTHDGNVGIGTGSSILANLHVRQDSGDGPILLLENRVVSGGTHKFGSLVFSPYRDVADPVYGAAVWAEGPSAAGYTADICFGVSGNSASSTFPAVAMRLNYLGNLTVVGGVNAAFFVGNLSGNATSATLANNATFATTASNANTATTALSVSGASSNGYGNRTVSSSAPSGGVDGDIWFQTMTGIFVHVSGSWLRVL